MLRATPERVYRAFLDPDAMAKWLPPHGFTGKVQQMEGRVGGPWGDRAARDRPPGLATGKQFGHRVSDERVTSRHGMATGWAREGAVQEQIDDTVKDGVARAKSRLPQGPSATHCNECGEPIPEARRTALAGVRLCVACQERADAETQHFTGYNRRGGKDSQLR